MNNLLGNEEAENGVNPNSEDLDLDAEEDDGNVVVLGVSNLLWDRLWTILVNEIVGI